MSLNLSKILARRFRTRTTKTLPIVKARNRSVQPALRSLELLEGRDLPSGGIEVLIWHDTNANGVKNSGEDGIAGRTAYLDINHNGTFNSGEPSLVTDGDGIVMFSGLAAGTYTVVDQLPSGWTPTVGSSAQKFVTVIDGEQPAIDFGSYLPVVSSISGTIWNDINGDGMITSGEPGLANWTVYLDTNSNGSKDTGEPSRVTAANGTYSFSPVTAGTYNVVEVLPAGGWLASPGYSTSKTVTVAAASAVTANFSNYQPLPGSVSGSIWNDINQNGKHGGSEPGIAGVTVFVDLDLDGAFTPGEPSDITTSTGSFTITGVNLGIYDVVEVLPVGWTPTLGFSTIQAVSVSYNTNTAVEFFNFYTTPGSIGGTVWNDSNADGLHSAGEAGQSGVTVYLDANNSDTLDAGEAFTTSGTGGAFSLGAVLAGTYTVAEVLPSGWLTSPGFTTTNTIAVTTGVAASVGFSNYLPAPGVISGTVWSDLDGNGTRSAGEIGVPNWQVYIDLNGDGAPTAGETMITTDATGLYVFTGITSGSYSIREVTQATWNPTSPATGARAITLQNGQNLTAIDFGLFQPHNASISGTTYFDANHNGTRDAGERGLSGIVVFLDLDNDDVQDPGEPTASTTGDLYYTPTVDESGSYSFTHLAPGTYHIREVVPAEQSDTPVAEVEHVITLVGTEDHPGINSGNIFRPNEIHGVRFDDLNGNHIRDLGEAATAGVSIYVDLDRDNVHDATEPMATTLADGSYTFTNMAPGAYVIREVESEDSVLTYPTTTGGILWPAGVSNPSIGDVTPTSITQSLAVGESYSQTVSLTLPNTGALTNMVDVFLLFDDTGSFTGNSPIVQAAFPQIISSLQASMPGINLGFGVGRFEDYGNFAGEYVTGRPFVLNQPVVASTTPGFSTAIQSALSRTAPGYGGDTPETLIEALFQTVTGAGFDGNNNGSVLESGAAGQVSTQINPGASGDVPSFASFTAGGEVLAPAGNRGGAGFRAGALPIILAATDTGFAYQPQGETSITGSGGLTLPLSALTQTARTTTPFNSGAGIQQTITGLNALGALVIGLGTNPDTTSDPRQDLSAIASLTGAINRGTTTIANGTPTPIAPGDPLYFLIQSGFSTSVVNGVVSAIQNAATSVAVNITLRASDPRVQIVNTPGTINNVSSGQTASFNVTFTGDGAPRRFDLQFIREGTDVVLGSIPVVLGTPIVGNGYEFEELEDGQIGSGIDFGSHSRPKVASVHTPVANGTYTTGQDIPLTLNFSTPVTLSGGMMNVTLSSGGSLSIAPFTGTTTAATYSIGAGESTPALDISTMALAPGASLKDNFGYDAVMTLPASNLTATASLTIVSAAAPTVSTMAINNGAVQRSRINAITVNFSTMVDASTLAGPNAITLTRTASLYPADLGTVVATGATGASGRIILSASSGFVSSMTLTFDNADGAGATSSVQYGSLADGYWQLAIPSVGYSSVQGDIALRRLYGDINGDGNVESIGDGLPFADTFGYVLGDSQFNAAFDFNNDGSIDSIGDGLPFGDRFGITL